MGVQCATPWFQRILGSNNIHTYLHTRYGYSPATRVGETAKWFLNLDLGTHFRYFAKTFVMFLISTLNKQLASVDGPVWEDKGEDKHDKVQLFFAELSRELTGQAGAEDGEGRIEEEEEMEGGVEEEDVREGEAGEEGEEPLELAAR